MNKEEFLNLSPIPGADFERDYSFLDYEGKVVLDVGADYGSTAAYFLRKGALQVVAVEGDEQLFRMLEENVMEVPEVVPVKCWISTPTEFQNLITQYRPNIVKVDCEGCENHLLGVVDRTFSRVSEYIMEIHNHELWQRFKHQFSRLGYTITHVEHWTTQPFEFFTGIGEVRIMYAISTELLHRGVIKWP